MQLTESRMHQPRLALQDFQDLISDHDNELYGGSALLDLKPKERMHCMTFAWVTRETLGGGTYHLHIP